MPRRLPKCAACGRKLRKTDSLFQLDSFLGKPQVGWHIQGNLDFADYKFCTLDPLRENILNGFKEKAGLFKEIEGRCADRVSANYDYWNGAPPGQTLCAHMGTKGRCRRVAKEGNLFCGQHGDRQKGKK